MPEPSLPQFNSSTGQIRSRCPDCDGAVTTFEKRHAGSEYGSIVADGKAIGGRSFDQIVYLLLRCAGCGRGGVARVGQYRMLNAIGHDLLEFFPYSRDSAPLPSGVPAKISLEYREAELCASLGALRAASALLRSVLEKLLRANGFEKGNLKDRIDEAAKEGMITEALRQRAHDNVRDLGNDIMHDEWREVDAEEFASAHRYVQRIIESFYDSRPQVEGLLTKAGRNFEKTNVP